MLELKSFKKIYFKKQYAALRAMCVEKKSCAGCIADRIQKISHFTSNVRFHSKWLRTWRRKAIFYSYRCFTPERVDEGSVANIGRSVEYVYFKASYLVQDNKRGHRKVITLI